jgi:8-oxo-dGTP diphosphatase
MRDAVAIVIQRDDRFVAIRRSASIAKAGYWSPPTGRLEEDESQIDAVCREAREEVGLVVVPLKKIWECVADDGHWRLHWWLATCAEEHLLPDLAEVAEARWVTVPEFLALAPLFEQHRIFFLDHYDPD